MKYNSVEPLEKITPDDGYNYFFGYYDLQPYDIGGKRHLTHRVSFNDRIPDKSDVAEIGFISVDEKKFHKVAETHAWNFQQGALLQWYDDDCVIFNDFLDGKYCSVIKNVKNGDERIINLPLACVSQDGKWGLSINFARIWDFRPGYGYCNKPDEFYAENAPQNDGVFLVDLVNNESKLIISYKKISELFPEKPFCDMKILVNHITFNPSAERFLMLVRNFAKDGERWGTLLLTADRNGDNIRNLTGYEVNSHYYWKNDEEIIIYSGLPEWGIYFMNDKTGERRRLYDDLTDYDDIHCIYSPDRSCFIGDGYPNTGNYRYIILYDFESGKSRALVRIFSTPVTNTDIRCDLHNRFNRDGTEISFDSFHDDLRCIMTMPFKKSVLSDNARKD